MVAPEQPDSGVVLELTALRRVWAVRRAAAEAVQGRVVLTGLRRPARDPDEQAWLTDRRETWFVEDEQAGAAARRYDERKYTKPPG